MSPTVSRETPRADPEAPSGALDRADRYLARVDAHLPSLWPASARVEFLDRQIEAWEAGYRRFIATEGATAPGADAADFLLTIAGLSARRSEIVTTLPIRALCETLSQAARAPVAVCSMSEARENRMRQAGDFDRE